MKVLISARTPEGQRTIDTFLLDGEPLTTERGKMVMLKALELSPALEALVNQTIQFI